MQPARTGLYASWSPKKLKLDVNDPEIGENFGNYSRLFNEIFATATALAQQYTIPLI